MPTVPTIPPYTPLTGITTTPIRQFQRRPSVGRYSDFEAREESFYVEEALQMVAEMWANYHPSYIAAQIRAKTGYPVTPKLVRSLKQRLDRLDRERKDRRD